MSAKQIEFMPVYEAADLWIERALKRDDSLFTPGEPIWSRDCIAKARTRFLDRIGAWKGADFFEQRLPAVLAGSPPEVYQLVGEALYVSYLIVHKTVAGKENKMARINQTLDGRAAIPHDLHDAMESGIMHPGEFMVPNIGIHLALVIEFVDKWKKEGLCDGLLDRDDPEAPWEFKKVVVDTTVQKLVKGYTCRSPKAQRVALLHLVHPDSFEAISRPNKEKLAKAPAFRRFITKPTNDDDCKIQQIRKGLEPKYGEDLTFFDPEIRPRW